MGLTFIILPSLFFLYINYVLNELLNEDSWSDDVECQSEACKFTHVLVLGCNPLLPAWLKLRTLYYYLKKLLKFRQGSNNDQKGEDFDGLLSLSKFAVLAEAALESAPQFIIQLYAMAVQQQSVSIIQMVSLPLSFLSIAWASTVADDLLQTELGNLHLSVKDKVLLFVTHLFILSSRLFAVALFTVSYKWWVTGVLIFHCTVIIICDVILICGKELLVFVVFFLAFFNFCFCWLRDDGSVLYFVDKTIRREKDLRRMLLLSNVMFVIENITMILLFYFSHFPHTWYSLPVTICVCLFAVLGAVMRLTHFCFLTMESEGQSNNTDRDQ